MTKRGDQAAYEAGRKALVAHYQEVVPHVRQDRKYWLRRVFGGLALLGVLCATGNTIIGGEERDAGYGYGGSYSADGLEGSEGQMDSGEVASHSPDAAVASPAASIPNCSLNSLIPVAAEGSGTRKFVLDLRSEVDTRNPEVTVLLPAARNGTIAIGEGGSVLLNPDGSRVAEIPRDSSPEDVYAVFLNAEGVETSCGGFFVDGPEDSSPTILSDQDQRVPPHS